MVMLEIGTGTMTKCEEQTHQSFWCALKSPLIIGADVTALDQSPLDILLNKKIIAINQDDLGTAASYLPTVSVGNGIQVWAGPLSRGRQVVLAFNGGKNTSDIYFIARQHPGVAGFTLQGSRGLGGKRSPGRER
jgi:alpha-galactosidase